VNLLSEGLACETDALEERQRADDGIATDGKDFKGGGLRRWPGSNARTTWTLWGK
jgi:hypothetical protein